jgi:hypothetical protein
MAVRETGVQLDFIAPSNLLALVRNTAPFLFDRLAAHPLRPGTRLIEAGGHDLGYLEILQGAEALESGALTGDEYIEDYFAYCVACHHATVATFVPTDVDSKIRGLLWRQARGRQTLRRIFYFTLRAMRWSIDGISLRATNLAGLGPVSGHNGEMLSVLAGALGAFLKADDAEYAGQAAEAIHQELEREAAELDFSLRSKGRELDALRIAASLTHNVGDLDQGISFWPNGERHRQARARFARLAHENTKPYLGAYQVAARIYRKAMSAEGHRNYPLRGVKPLRRSADLLLPLAPCLDDWGSLVARHPALSNEDRAEVLAALLHGCRTIPGQRGYYRAIAGLVNTLGAGIEVLTRHFSSKARSDWKDPDTRKQIAVPRVSFESMMKKQLVAALAS